jgi:hypothetical protein
VTQRERNAQRAGVQAEKLRDLALTALDKSARVFDKTSLPEKPVKDVTGFRNFIAQL